MIQDSVISLEKQNPVWSLKVIYAPLDMSQGLIASN